MKKLIMFTKKIAQKLHIEYWKLISAFLVLYDAVAVNLAYFLALWLRSDGYISQISPDFLEYFLKSIPVYTVVSILIFNAARMYHSVWRFASYKTLLKTVLGSLCASFFNVAFTIIMMSIQAKGFARMPLSFYVLGAIFQIGLLAVIRFSYRFALLENITLDSPEHADKKDRKNVMIVGAGAAGQMILRDVSKSNEVNDKVCCMIDDNPNKWSRYIDGVKIVGGREDILVSAEKYNIDKIYVAIPTATREELRDILNICGETNCEVKNLPGVYQLVNGEVNVGHMKDVSVEDLLGRDPIQADMEEIFKMIKNKTVMVTGGGGSIGSELCRQIASHNPKKLIIFDIYENNAYAIQQELKESRKDLDMEVLIGSVRDSRRVLQVFNDYKPNIVFHAAAHKHVPLMEDSPCEAIKNNAIGTYKTAYAAMINGVDRFVLISTDKAVNPTNIMGASKRFCEMIVQSFDKKIKDGKASEIPMLFTHREKKIFYQADFEKVKTEFVAVRFGNVLGSNGSVVPLFKKQIEHGGPVTVTHPDIIRYFMTIPEAVSLVLLAGKYAKGGEIFVLDMGSPVKVDTLAKNLIKLSGYKPNVDIMIEYTGLRPGEKLYEEKLMAEEDLQKTENKLIHIGKPIPFDVDEFFEELEEVVELAYSNSPEIIGEVEKIVTTYRPLDQKQAEKMTAPKELIKA